MAREAGFDLMEVSPNPPVCKYVDFGKYKYKMQKKHGKSSGTKKLKEIKMGIKIASHDLDLKISHAIELIEDNHLVRVVIQLRGRELARKDEALRMMNSIIEKLLVVSKIQEELSVVGGNISATFIHNKKNKS